MPSHFQIVNPAILLASSQIASGCGARSDAPVCKDGESDVTCDTEIFRGCDSNETDCANCATNADNQDDACCAGSSSLGPGDNIDHESCHHNDADFGGHADVWCLLHIISDMPRY